MVFLEELLVATKEHRKVLELSATTTVEDQMQGILTTNISFKSQMKETSRLRDITLIKTLRCNLRKMALHQEPEKPNNQKQLWTHQLSWATLQVPMEACSKIKALELIKVANWLVRFIIQLRKSKVILRIIFMLTIIVPSIETIFLSQIQIKRITKHQVIMKMERTQLSKWSKVDHKFLGKLDKDLKWRGLKCWKISMRRKIRCHNL